MGAFLRWHAWTIQAVAAVLGALIAAYVCRVPLAAVDRFVARSIERRRIAPTLDRSYADDFVDIEKLTEHPYVVRPSGCFDLLTVMARRAVLSMTDGAPTKVLLHGVWRGSLFDRLGLRSSDLIHSLNGIQFDSLAKALEIYQWLQHASRIDVGLERNGRPMMMSYWIEWPK